MIHRLSSLTKHTAHITTVLFAIGFIFDFLVLPNISHSHATFLGAVYLCAIAILVMFREWVVSRNTASNVEQKIYSFATFGISYFLGSALSFIFVYSFLSAAFSVSWPLFVLFIICIVANEFVNTHNFRLTLDIGIFLIALLFFAIFNIPIFLKTQNDIIFAVSIGITIIFSLFYLYLLQFTSDSARYEAPRMYALAIGIPMFVGMLYFLNVIPAVPLSLKSSGIYHNIVRTESGEFIAQKESDFRKFLYFRSPIYSMSSLDTGVYFFSAVDAPVELSAPISHVWEQYNESTKKWIPKTTVFFTMEGGRNDGYRAYSYKENITDGLWRVSVKVDSNRLVGRVKFIIKQSEKVELKEIKL